MIRDYYCSKVSKGAYLYEPVDLLMFSAALSEENLKVTDAVAQRLGVAATLEQAPVGEDDLILGLIGQANASEDLAFYRALRERTRARIYLSGDMAQDPTGEALRGALSFADGLLLDFSDKAGLLAVAAGNPEACDSVALKHRPAVTSRAKGHGKSVGTPRHDLFPLASYNYPFVKRRPFATVLTDFGCAYACTFCIMSSIGFTTRPPEEVDAELGQIAGLGVHDVYLSDQTFGAHPKHTAAMLDLLERHAMRWVCFTRADLMAEGDLALRLKKAGCHTVMLGIETIHEATQQTIKKFAVLPQVEAGIRKAKEAGLKVLGTFLVGLPGESLVHAEATLKWALSSGLDYASVNLAVPRNRTSLAEGGHTVTDQDQGGSLSSLVDPDLQRFYNQFGLKFYSRPKVAWGLFREMMSPGRISVLAPEAVGFLGRSLQRARG